MRRLKHFARIQSCSWGVANDVTTSANTAKITASSATSVTMTWSGTLTANEVLHMCDAY